MPNIKTTETYNACTVCNGLGHVTSRMYSPLTSPEGLTTATKCTACDGKGVLLWSRIIETEEFRDER